MSTQKLKADVREITGYTDGVVLTDSALGTAYDNAKRHLRVTVGLDANTNWFDPDEPAREDALYWWTVLFAKLAVGDLDAQDLQIGAVDSQSLLAKDNDSVTQWFRNARNAQQSLSAAEGMAYGHRHETLREDRTYGGNDSGAGDDGLDTNI